MVFTDDCVSGVSVSNGGLRCIPNPQPFAGGNYVTYDRASDDPDINDVLYIGYFGVGAWATTAGGGSYNFYFTHNPGTDWEANMSNYWATFGFTPTDAGYIPYNPPISRQLYAYRAWGFLAGVNGQGIINEPVLAPSATGHLANIQAMLASETPYGPEIKNAAVFTPLAGSLLTANQYFAGGSTPITLSCQKSFVMLATDGNPTSDWWGNMYPLSSQQNTYNSTSSTWTFSPAAQDVFGQITALRSVSVGGTTHDIQTYVVGMGDTVANPSSVAAMNQFASLGGTNTAYLAQDSNSLASAFQAIAVDIESKTAAASAVSLNTGSWGTGTNLYQARFNSGDWSGQLIALPDQRGRLDRRAAVGFGSGHQWPGVGYRPVDPDLQALGIAWLARHRVPLADDLPGNARRDRHGPGAVDAARHRRRQHHGRHRCRARQQRRCRHGFELLQLGLSAERGHRRPARRLELGQRRRMEQRLLRQQLPRLGADQLQRHEDADPGRRVLGAGHLLGAGRTDRHHDLQPVRLVNFAVQGWDGSAWQTLARSAATTW